MGIVQSEWSKVEKAFDLEKLRGSSPPDHTVCVIQPSLHPHLLPSKYSLSLSHMGLLIFASKSTTEGADTPNQRFILQSLFALLPEKGPVWVELFGRFADVCGAVVMQKFAFFSPANLHGYRKCKE